MPAATAGAGVLPRGRAGAARRREVRLAYVLLSPAVVLLLLVLAYPLAWETWVSLTDLSPLKEGGAEFVGLENYRRFLVDPDFWQAVAVTVLFAVVTSAAKLALGVGFALLLARRFRGRALVFLAVFLPWAYPASVSVIGWYWTLSPPVPTAYSVFMGTLKYTVDSAFGSGAWAFLSVTLFNIWRGSSFIGIFLLAGINAVPPELFEYALLESKSAWRRFWHVTVPLLRPFFALAIFLSLTTAFADLANVWMLTAGRIIFPVVGTHAYWLAIKSGQFGPASALSLMLVPLLLGALLVLFRLFDPPEEEARA
jgi:multiple sugar transport system permease protein